MSLVKQKHLNLYKKYTVQLIKDLGKTISVYLSESEHRCNNCKYDSVHNCSSGEYNGTGPKPFNGIVCPVCNSSGKISTPSVKNITAICRFVGRNDSDNKYSKEEYGLEEIAFLKVKTEVSYYEYFINAEYFIFDGDRYKLKNIIKRGMKENVVLVAYLEKENV